jgi:hypothetical protein
MPQYTTIDEVKGFVGTLEEQRALTKAVASKSEKNTFLSHSSKDNDLVPGVALVLHNHGAQVYADLGDNRLPEPPSVETAHILRDTISEMRRFVLLVSSNSKGSIWIPWELGLADGQKSPAAVALFPVVEQVTESKWAEQEYLGLYRRVVWGPLEGHEKNVWMVYDHHTNTASHLGKWLRGN